MKTCRGILLVLTVSVSFCFISNFAFGADSLYVDPSGNVGVGTSSPSPGKKLHIETPGLGDSDTVTSSNVGGLFIKGTQSDGNYDDVGISLGFATGSSYNSFISLHKTASNNSDLVIGTHDTERIRVKGSGNVGINNPIPSYTLDIKGNMRLTDGDNANLIFKSPGGSGNSLLQWKDNSDVIDFYFGQTAEKGPLYLYNYGVSELSLSVNPNGNVGLVNDRLFVRQSTGNVGIGTTLPLKALQIDTLGLGSSDTVTSSNIGGQFIKGTQSDGNYDDVGIIFGFATGSSYNSFISLHKTATTNHDLVFGTHDTERIRIRGNGNVGIGVKYPVETLQVGGNIAPGISGEYDLGAHGLRWENVYANNCFGHVSDERLKDNIRTISLGLDFITQLRPIAYKWKDYHVPEVKETIATERQKTRRVTKEVKEDAIELVNGKYVKARRVEVKEVEEPVFEEHPLYDESGQQIGTHIIPVMETVEEEVVVQKERNRTFSSTHYGFSAQQVKATLDKFGVDFDGVVYHEENDTYGIRMGEFVPILMKAVQELKAEVDQLKAEISALKK